MSEEYNGWKNRETWAYNLWLENDEGFYREIRDKIDELIGDNFDEDNEEDFGQHTFFCRLADWLEEYLNELQDACYEGGSKSLRDMMEDIGSKWRIDYFEIAKNHTDQWDEFVEDYKKSEKDREEMALQSRGEE